VSVEGMPWGKVCGEKGVKSFRTNIHYARRPVGTTTF